MISLPEFIAAMSAGTEGSDSRFYRFGIGKTYIEPNREAPDTRCAMPRPHPALTPPAPHPHLPPALNPPSPCQICQEDGWDGLHARERAAHPAHAEGRQPQADGGAEAALARPLGGAGGRGVEVAFAPHERAKLDAAPRLSRSPRAWQARRSDHARSLSSGELRVAVPAPTQ